MGRHLRLLALLLTAPACYLDDFSGYHEEARAAGGQSGGGGGSVAGQGGTGPGGSAGAAGSNQFCSSGAIVPTEGAGGSGVLSPSATIRNQTCPSSSDDPDPCIAALKTQCCEVRDHCLTGNNDCAQLLPCIEECSASKSLGTCFDTCFDTYPLGANAYALFISCAAVLDGKECETTASACNDCIVDSCQDEYLDCHGDAACLLLTTCLGECHNKQACENDCYEKHGGLKTNIKLDLFLRCSGEKCAGPCSQQNTAPGPDGQSAGVLLQACPEACAGTYCDACEQGACCHTREACQGQDACMAIVQCVAACPRSNQRACEQQCVTDHPQGAEVYAPHAACRELYCVDSDCPWRPVTTCETCLWLQCPGRTALCDGDALCHQRRRCELACEGEQACLTECKKIGGPAVDTLMANLETCATQLCASTCP